MINKVNDYFLIIDYEYITLICMKSRVRYRCMEMSVVLKNFSLCIESPQEC